MSGRVFNLDVPVPEYADTDEQAQDLLHLCLKKIQHHPSDFVGFDTETTGKKMPFKVGTRYPLDWMTDTVTFWSLSFYDPWQETHRRWAVRGEHLQYFAPVLEHPDAWLAIWNAKYDAHVCWNMDINIWNANVIDGLAMAGLHDENRMRRNLKASALEYCGLPMTKFKDLFPDKDEHGKKIVEYETDLRTLPTDQVVDYSSYDAYCHLKVVERIRDWLIATPISRDGYNLWQYFLDMEKDITEVLWRMERRGMLLDGEMLESKIPIIDKRIDALERDIFRLARGPININSHQQMASLFFGPKDKGGMGLMPVKMTKGDNPSVDEEVLKLMDSTGIEIASKIVACRSLKKTKSTYLTTLIALIKYHGDGRIHPNFNQFGARTGRFSTDVPNSQNFPRPDKDEWGIRLAFIASPGCRLIVSDYEQLEMRIMAHMSGDPEMIRAIMEGKDLHSFTVTRMVPGVTYEEVIEAKKAGKEATDRQKWLQGLRQDNKAIGFGIIYGKGPKTLGEGIDIKDEDVEERIHILQDREFSEPASSRRRRSQTFSQRVKRSMERNPLLTVEKAHISVARTSIAQDKINAYFQSFPKVKEYMADIPNECRYLKEKDFWGNDRDWNIDFRDGSEKPLTITGHFRSFGFVQTLCGRYRRLEDINHKNYRFRSEAERQAVNTTIQGSAADIIKGAMLRIEFNRRLNELEVEMLNQVHDELVLQVPVRHIEEATAIVEECMIHPFSPGKEALSVPLPVSLKVVERWAHAK